MHAQVNIELTQNQCDILETVIMMAQSADEDDRPGMIVLQVTPWKDGTASAKGAFVPHEKAAKIQAILKDAEDKCPSCGHNWDHTHEWYELDGSWHCYGCHVTVHEDPNG